MSETAHTKRSETRSASRARNAMQRRIQARKRDSPSALWNAKAEAPWLSS